MLRRLLGCLPAAILLVSAAAAGQGSFPTLPVHVTVATHEDAPAVSEAWIRRQLRNANRLFNQHGVRFQLTDVAAMPERHARLENRRDRHALGAMLEDGRIDWFIVHSLRDVDEPERFRQGVHWRPRGEGYAPRAHLVITSSIAGEHVLAHELGHYFGNGHSDVPGNIMSYERGEGPPFFDETQVQRVRFSLRRFLRRGEIVGLPEVTE
ncbi:MAG: hypothetical protein AB8I08_25130 [Sandaracinaceae bacterium]